MYLYAYNQDVRLDHHTPSGQFAESSQGLIYMAETTGESNTHLLMTFDCRFKQYSTQF